MDLFVFHHFSSNKNDISQQNNCPKQARATDAAVQNIICPVLRQPTQAGESWCYVKHCETVVWLML